MRIVLLGISQKKKKNQKSYLPFVETLQVRPLYPISHLQRLFLRFTQKPFSHGSLHFTKENY